MAIIDPIGLIDHDNPTIFYGKGVTEASPRPRTKGDLLCQSAAPFSPPHSPWPLSGPLTLTVCGRLRPRASTSAMFPVLPTTPLSAMVSMLSLPWRRARQGRRSGSCLFLHQARAWFFQRLIREVRSKSAAKATACSSERRPHSRIKVVFQRRPAGVMAALWDAAGPKGTFGFALAALARLSVVHGKSNEGSRRIA